MSTSSRHLKREAVVIVPQWGGNERVQKCAKWTKMRTCSKCGEVLKNTETLANMHNGKYFRKKCKGFPPIPYQKSRNQKKNNRENGPQARLLLHALIRRSEIFIFAHIKKASLEYHLGIKSKAFTCWNFSKWLTGSLVHNPNFTSSSHHDGIFAFFEVDLSH